VLLRSCIREVYYEEIDGKRIPNGCTQRATQLGSWESIESLFETTKKVKLAFAKPILDLDNWPNEWMKK
jgi:hypothetical protein